MLDKQGKIKCAVHEHTAHANSLLCADPAIHAHLEGGNKPNGTRYSKHEFQISCTTQFTNLRTSHRHPEETVRVSQQHTLAQFTLHRCRCDNVKQLRSQKVSAQFMAGAHPSSSYILINRLKNASAPASYNDQSKEVKFEACSRNSSLSALVAIAWG